MKVDLFYRKLIKAGFSPFMGVPCSVLKHLINYLKESSNSKYYIASSESEAMGLAAGFSLSGRFPVVMFQNDGYGNAVNPLSSLQLLYELPCLMLITWRGEPKKPDAAQHFVMGKTILDLLKLFEIPYRILTDNVNQFNEYINIASQFLREKSRPFAFIIRKSYFEEYKARKEIPDPNLDIRISYLEVLEKFIDKKDVIIGTTGFTGREVEQLIKHEGRFYMMGSMGCAASIGLGIAENNPDKKIYVLDGDGALIMKMGTMSTIGYYKPCNLFHICFDNNQYESTGGQETTSRNVDFINVARACGYKNVKKIKTSRQFAKILRDFKNIKGPHFVHIYIKPGTIADLKRPSLTPLQMKKRFLSFIKN